MKIFSIDRIPIAACAVINLENGFELSLSTISTIPDMRLFQKSNFGGGHLKHDLTSRCFENSDHVDITPENILTAIQFAQNW